MGNKYLYAFLKDGTFRVLCVLSVIGVVLCLILIRLHLQQGQEFRVIQYKQAMIAEIPALQAKLGAKEVVTDHLVLKGIILHKDQPVAAINDTFVKIGDNIDGKKVAIITDHNVTLCDIKALDKCTVLVLEQ